LYAELAATAMASFRSSKYNALMEPVRLNDGFKESSALKKFRGEDDDDFQFLEYQVMSGSIVSFCVSKLLKEIGCFAMAISQTESWLCTYSALFFSLSCTGDCGVV
jgi:hypothetical protein